MAHASGERSGKHNASTGCCHILVAQQLTAGGIVQVGAQLLLVKPEILSKRCISMLSQMSTIYC